MALGHKSRDGYSRICSALYTGSTWLTPSAWCTTGVGRCRWPIRRRGDTGCRSELQDGSVKRDYIAREVTGEEKADWWKRALETWTDYAKYQTKTVRQIPVFVLESAEGP